MIANPYIRLLVILLVHMGIVAAMLLLLIKEPTKHLDTIKDMFVVINLAMLPILGSIAFILLRPPKRHD